ncbi:hypothetical protein BE221DRAFT_55880, partial [Ostreococcus tauri]
MNGIFSLPSFPSISARSTNISAVARNSFITAPNVAETPLPGSPSKTRTRVPLEPPRVKYSTTFRRPTNTPLPSTRDVAPPTSSATSPFARASASIARVDATRGARIHPSRRVVPARVVDGPRTGAMRTRRRARGRGL